MDERTEQGKRKLQVWVPKELSERLDVARDGRPMGVYVARLLEQALDGKHWSRLDVRETVERLRREYEIKIEEVDGDYPGGIEARLALRELLRRLEEGV